MSAPVTCRVVFLGGPCDGLEQTASQPPPTPEYPQPRAGSLDAVYVLEKLVGTTYTFTFTGYRERKT